MNLTNTIRAFSIRPGDLIQGYNNARRWPTAMRVTKIDRDNEVLVFTLMDGSKYRIFPMNTVAFHRA